ncbi:MAG TPA: metallophosphoesterase family protein [Gammaproteobacteria bacterium]|nr:metallophosphoesterase family protein [Gammaproteobacteria bacterium]
MILATVSDIHGHWPALSAILDAIDNEGIHTIVNAGDCVGGHPWPNEVICCLRQREIVTAQGEWDYRAAKFLRKERALRARMSAQEFEALETAFGACGVENIEYLRALRRVQTLLIDGVRILVCHGTLTSHSESLRDSEDDARYARQREIEPADIIVTGATHVPHHRRVNGTLFVNPGAGGGTGQNEGLANFAIISTEEEPWSVEFRQAPIGGSAHEPQA